MAKRRKKATRRRFYRRPRRNPTVVVRTASSRKRGRRSRRHRKNPLLPTGILTKALVLGAGYLATPMISKMIPWEPPNKLMEYAKTGVVVGIGSQLARMFLGKQYANALMAGGFLWIAVDALRTYVTPFAGGVGHYYPPDDELVASWAPSGLPPGAELPGSTYYLPSVVGSAVH